MRIINPPLILKFFFLTFTVVFLFCQGCSGEYSKKDFVKSNCKAAQEYSSNTSMDQIDMEVLQNYFAGINIVAVKNNYLKEFDLPNDIIYYSFSNGKKTEAYRIKKGTRVNVDMLDKMWFGTGFYSFPTYKKGWRYVHPFTIVGEEAVTEYYYVKLKDLEKAASVLFEEDHSRKLEIDNLGWTKKEAVHDFVRVIDKSFYAGGVYCSLD